MSAESQDKFEKNAEIRITLHAESGYEAELTGKVSAAQWGAINAIVHGPGNPEEKNASVSSSNIHGLDVCYFREKLSQLVRDLTSYTPDEMARALARLAKTADEKVLREPEFAVHREPPTPIAVLRREIGEDTWFDHTPVLPGSKAHLALQESGEMDYCVVYAGPPEGVLVAEQGEVQAEAVAWQYRWFTWPEGEWEECSQENYLELQGQPDKYRTRALYAGPQLGPGEAAGDYVKVFRTEWGQLLVINTTDENNDPEVQLHFQPPGLGICKMKLTFLEGESGDPCERCDKAFAEMTAEKAFAAVQSVIPPHVLEGLVKAQEPADPGRPVVPHRSGGGARPKPGHGAPKPFGHDPVG